MNKFFIGVKLLQYTFEHWKCLIFDVESDPHGDSLLGDSVEFEAEYFFNMLTERSQLWNEY